MCAPSPSTRSDFFATPYSRLCTFFDRAINTVLASTKKNATPGHRPDTPEINGYPCTAVYTGSGRTRRKGVYGCIFGAGAAVRALARVYAGCPILYYNGNDVGTLKNPA